jgi:hypothetical protein
MTFDAILDQVITLLEPCWVPCSCYRSIITAQRLSGEVTNPLEPMVRAVIAI